MKNKGQVILSNLAILIMFVVVVFVAGIFGGVVYYELALVDSTLHTINFQIPIMDNSTQQGQYNITDFQDLLGVSIYPLLGLRTSIPYLSYFMVFAFIIALAMVGYISSKNPIFFVVHILITILITYFCIILSNTYLELLENPFINQLMVDFVIYNKLMIYLPAIMFFTSLIFGAIAFINIMKPQSNTTGNQISLNYGGDY